MPKKIRINQTQPLLPSILQWNINGIQAHIQELKLLNEGPGISKNYQIIAIQEPKAPAHKIHLLGYALYTSRAGRPGAHPRAALLIKNDLPQYRINLDDLCGERAEYAAA